MRTLTAAVLVTALVAPGALSAQRQGTFLTPLNEPTTRVGARGANFLEIGVGARGQALGYAYTALAEGADAMYWNPAGLAVADGLIAAFTRADLYDNLDITHNFAGLAIPFAGGVAGVSYIGLGSGPIPRTDENFPAGGNPSAGDTFEWTSSALGLHYARRLTDRLQVGFSGRAVSEGIANASSNWWGVDIGTKFRTGLYGITLGAVLANIGPAARAEGGAITTRVTSDEAFSVNLPVRFNTVAYQLPTTFRFSVLTDLVGSADALLSANPNHAIRLALDLNDGVDTDIQTSVGLEYNFKRLVFLRGGKRFMNEAHADFREFSHNLSFGGGLRLPMFGRHLAFDYAYTNMGELQNVQVFSFEIGN